MINVAVLDDYQNAFRQIIDLDKYKDKFNFVTFNEPFLNEDDVVQSLEQFDALFIMRERTPITKNIINGLPKLKYIITSGMRNNSIDLKSAKEKNSVVCGTEINSNPAAELTWALILGLIRNLKQEIDNMFQGYWQTTIGSELKRKKGLASLVLEKLAPGAAVAKAFGMEVSAWSENLNLSNANKLGVLPMSKEDLLKTSDFVSIHVVGGDRYKELITKKELSLMKKTAFLINTSRGSIVNQKRSYKSFRGRNNCRCRSRCL